MKQTNYLKLFSIFAFMLFGGVSCWATAESLHLLLATWPKIFCYLVAIGFFVVAAIGTKLIVDSLNQKIYVEGRTGKLIGGIILVLIFWLATSMPTNTHTFIYRNVIAERVNNDIAVTQGYLSDIIQNTKEIERVDALMQERQNAVRRYLNRVIAEIDQPEDPGSGPRVEGILLEMEAKYSYTIDPCRIKGKNIHDINKAKDYYNKQFNKLIEEEIPLAFAKEVVSPNEANLEEANAAYKNLQLLKNRIDGQNGDGRKIDLNSSEDMHEKVITQINKAYQAVNLNRNMVNFQKQDEEKYRNTPIVTETQRMTSIFEVWGDYMAGKFNGHGFFWWILLAVLIDVAAFIFFDIAFKKTEY